MSRYTLDSELLKDSLKRERVDIWVLVKEEVVLMLECHKKFFGLEDKELLEDFLESIELLVKLTLKFTRSFTCSLKVTSIRIRRS